MGKEIINQDKVPNTIKDVVDDIVARLGDEDREAIEEAPSPVAVHHSVGRYLRNSLSLWNPDTPLKRDAVNTYGIAHADDISGLILEWVYAIVRSVDFDPHEIVERYKRHWKAYGTDALSAGGWPPKEARYGE